MRLRKIIVQGDLERMAFVVFFPGLSFMEIGRVSQSQIIVTAASVCWALPYLVDMMIRSLYVTITLLHSLYHGHFQPAAGLPITTSFIHFHLLVPHSTHLLTMSTTFTTFLFLLLAALVTLFLSTIQIYLPPSSSTPHTLTEASGPYKHITSPTSDFLFRVGELHVYGIHTLFMGVVLGTSILAVGVVGYFVLGLRRVVEWDMSEQWRTVVREDDGAQEEWWIRRSTKASMVGDPMSRPSIAWRRNTLRKARGLSAFTIPRPSFRASFSVYSPRPSIERSSRLFSGPHRAHGGDMLAPPRRRRAQTRAASLLQPRTAKTNSRLRRPEDLAPEHGRRDAWRDPSATASLESDTTSGYDIPSYIPSYYFKELDDNRRMVSSVYSRTSIAIPSYCFTELDEDGNSIAEGQKRTSHEMRDLGVLARKPEVVVMRPPQTSPREIVRWGEGEIGSTDERVQSQCASWTGTTAVSEDSGRK